MQSGLGYGARNGQGNVFSPYGNIGGACRFLVACSNAYAIVTSTGSLHAAPVNVTPNGAGFGSNPAGNGVAPGGNVTASNAKGTVMLGYPGRAAMLALLTL